ncbi:FAD-dependent oxidoreductase [Paraflavitalea soli]|uniref:FAD-dependent oxidoreductase n=1 Tax=Paraflavitalea soli TaxID=2315862 RepID=A0A3B7MEQ8_9BACT|nr:FAD-dependent oxidoreductase [Paraflavitalea soli]AXY72814.1 FAD-dependent oxidoreductase [Paraflavitalea soli]
MRRLKKSLIILTIFTTALTTRTYAADEYDICVYGATSAGVIAAYTAKMMGKSVVLIEPGNHIGGLSSGGLGMTDIGNKYVVSGLALDFYRRMGTHYGRLESWTFEPHVAKDIFLQYIREAKIKVLLQHQLTSVLKTNRLINSITVISGKTTITINAKMFIDCTYEGDLMAKAGISYTVGREANSQYKENWNGVQLLNKHQFPEGVDPYKTPGQPASGLLWGISPAPLAGRGSADKKVQAYNFRICLTNNPANRIEITRPGGYDSSRYELLLRLLEKKPAPNLNAILKMDKMPNNKTDINNNGGFSTDMIGMNYDYPDADYQQRKIIVKRHEDYIKGLLYFVGHDERMPAPLRKEMLQWGYPTDEYPDNGNWSPQMYVREARRMVGEYVMTQANCQGKAIVHDGIGMAAYTMDSHNCQRIVDSGMVKNEGDVQVGGFGPYPVSYRAILPRSTECTNLLVPVCLSASHIAYGSIRMEPVFMVLAQSAATAAVMAINHKTPLHEVNINELRQLINKDPLVNGSTPDIVVDNADTASVSMTGDWQKQKNDGYGPDYFVTVAETGKKSTMTFRPVITTPGNYAVYVYTMPGRKNAAETMQWTVSDGRETKQVTVQRANIQVVGQTSGEWHLLGHFNLTRGSNNTVEISTLYASGEITGDAVLFRKNN